MQIVIDISEKQYEIAKEYVETVDDKSSLAKAIVNGTVLPKGHGRIGDLDQILLWMIYTKGIIDNLECGEIAPVFKDATIIEAESEETTE